MIIDCVSDLHGRYPKLPGGDILIIAGDCVSNDEIAAWDGFFHWLKWQDYRKKIVVAGNHDNYLFEYYDFIDGDCDSPDGDFEYLCDREIEFEGLRIYGTPWTSIFRGQNPKCMAFSVDESELEEKFKKIPCDVDILISHGPMKGVLDDNIRGELCGSESLHNHVRNSSPKIMICGHIHEDGIKECTITSKCGKPIHVANVSYCDHQYKRRNKFYRIHLNNGKIYSQVLDEGTWNTNLPVKKSPQEYPFTINTVDQF